ncbi:hypothetical protein [Nocardia sp. NPDC051570]|uniref:hypothetical protein n=1 Tax=Nocardia sp. NPDC051570 TaxID=3364324 RepID=UPI0037B32E1E
MIVAIVGADGAGKTTVTRAAAERLGTSATVVDRWDIVGSPHYPTAAFLEADVRRVRSCAVGMAPESRLLFLLWAAVASVTDRVAESETDSVLLLDGYWMKHAASEIVYGMDECWVEAVGAGLPGADRVVYLRSDPQTAWDRIGARAVPYECGLDPSCAQSSFLHHQGRIHEIFDSWANRQNWAVVDTRRPFAPVVDAVVEAVLA